MTHKTTVKPIAVLISDIHFTPNTLELATSSLKQAQLKALELKVPLIIAGDILDTKAIIRAECANRLIDLFSTGNQPTTFIIVGNHDLINEKSNENSLNFLKRYVNIIDNYTEIKDLNLHLIPYQSNKLYLERLIYNIPKESTLIMHQGVQSAKMGHYIVDYSSLPQEVFQDYRVISGHYHSRQDIKCGRPRKGAVGLFSYIGNPYTLSFSEANDPEKGFQILLDNGLLEFVPTKLRKHVILEYAVNQLTSHIKVHPEDLLWVKIKGYKSELNKINKKLLGSQIIGHSNFKLDLIPIESIKFENESNKKINDFELLDKLIEHTNDTEDQKNYMKQLWREIMK